MECGLRRRWRRRRCTRHRRRQGAPVSGRESRRRSLLLEDRARHQRDAVPERSRSAVRSRSGRSVYVDQLFSWHTRRGHHRWQRPIGRTLDRRRRNERQRICRSGLHQGDRPDSVQRRCTLHRRVLVRRACRPRTRVRPRTQWRARHRLGEHEPRWQPVHLTV